MERTNIELILKNTLRKEDFNDDLKYEIASLELLGNAIEEVKVMLDRDIKIKKIMGNINGRTDC